MKTITKDSILEDSISRRLKIREYIELTKPRLSFLSIITAIVGYIVVNKDRNVVELMSLIIGTALAAGGAGALNQWFEREVDAKMERTRNRPIPSAQISASAAFFYGMILSVMGCLVIAYGNNQLACLLTIMTLVSYVLIYTPLKQVTPWAVEIGAIPGALPPLIGCAAANGSLDVLGWILFSILFIWQIPHFMAISWMYKEDYARGDMKMLSVIDTSGRKVGVHAILYTILLIIISSIPFLLGFTSWVYEVCTVLLGIYFFKKSYVFYKMRDKSMAAKKLFYASIFYLPFYLLILVIDRWLII